MSLDLGNPKPKVIGLPPLPLKPNGLRSNLKPNANSSDDKSSYEQLKTKLKEVSDKCFNSAGNKPKTKMAPSKLKLFSRFYKSDSKEGGGVPLSPSGRKVRSFSFGGIPAQEQAMSYDDEEAEEEDGPPNFELRVNPLYTEEPNSPSDLPDHVIMGMSLDDFKAYTHTGQSGGSGASNNSDGDSGIVNETLDNHSIFLDSEPSSSSLGTKFSGGSGQGEGERWESGSWLSRPPTPIKKNNQSSSSSHNPSLQLQGEYKLVRVSKVPPFPHPSIKTKSIFNNMSSLSTSSTLDLGISLDKNSEETSACGYLIKDLHPDSPIAR
jgi:hypothetical protein